jgi:hypothetical protein
MASAAQGGQPGETYRHTDQREVGKMLIAPHDL